jgi:rubrerythrin
MARALDIVGLIEKLALIEEEGVAFYEALAKHTSNEKIGKLASTMAKVEKRHQERFERIHENLLKRGAPKATGKLTATVQKYILTLIDHRIFLGPDGAERLARNLTDENEAIDMAIQFEKENILLLLECKDIVGPSTKKVIQTFIEQEKSHIRSIQKVREQLARLP